MQDEGSDRVSKCGDDGHLDSGQQEAADRGLAVGVTVNVPRKSPGSRWPRRQATLRNRTACLCQVGGATDRSLERDMIVRNE